MAATVPQLRTYRVVLEWDDEDRDNPRARLPKTRVSSRGTPASNSRRFSSSATRLSFGCITPVSLPGASVLGSACRCLAARGARTSRSLTLTRRVARSRWIGTW